MLRQAEYRSLGDRHGSQFPSPVIDVAEDVPMERPQMIQVITSRQPTALQVNSRDADNAASTWANSPASVMPSRLRSAPLTGSIYGSTPADRLTPACQSGNATGSAPAAHL